MVKELEGDGSASFHFIQGPYEVAPPVGYEDFFGGPPYHRFIVPTDAEADSIDVIERIRDFPQLETPEMTMRELMTYGVAKTDDSARHTLEFLYGIMEKEGPFDGIIGYSEGATIAGTLLLHEQVREELEGRPPMFKCALFFGGWPPITPTLDGLVLADESDLTIEIPTTHISMFCVLFVQIAESLTGNQSVPWILISTAILHFTTYAIQTQLSFLIMQKDTLCREISIW